MGTRNPRRCSTCSSRRACKENGATPYGSKSRCRFKRKSLQSKRRMFETRRLGMHA